MSDTLTSLGSVVATSNRTGACPIWFDTALLLLCCCEESLCLRWLFCGCKFSFCLHWTAVWPWASNRPGSCPTWVRIALLLFFCCCEISFCLHYFSVWPCASNQTGVYPIWVETTPPPFCCCDISLFLHGTARSAAGSANGRLFWISVGRVKCDVSDTLTSLDSVVAASNRTGACPIWLDTALLLFCCCEESLCLRWNCWFWPRASNRTGAYPI